MKRFFALLAAGLMIFSVFAFAEETFAEETMTALDVFDMIRQDRYEDLLAVSDDQLRAALTETVFSSLLPSLEKTGGAFVRTGEEETGEMQGYTVRLLHLVYEKSGFAFRTMWDQEGRLAGLNFLPEALAAADTAAMPDTVKEEEISISDPALPGTLCLPENMTDPLPAVILIHGSGPSDRDEALGGTALFRDLAWGLAEKGIAVLRFDKRTFVYGAQLATQDLTRFTIVDESIADAWAAAKLLAEDPRIDPERIWLCGHSLGAMITPRAVQSSPVPFAGMVLLSGTPYTLAEIVLHQNQAAVDAMPKESRAAAQSQVDELLRQWQELLSMDEAQVLKREFAGQSAYYFWEMAQYDTAEILRSLSVPALVINGGADFQIPDADGYEAWKALDFGENVKLIHDPELNHMLMNPDVSEDVRGSVGEYNVPCRLPETVISEISDFISPREIRDL